MWAHTLGFSDESNPLRKFLCRLRSHRYASNEGKTELVLVDE